MNHMHEGHGVDVGVWAASAVGAAAIGTATAGTRLARNVRKSQTY